jgi:hypothetical protein
MKMITNTIRTKILTTTLILVCLGFVVLLFTLTHQSTVSRRPTNQVVRSVPNSPTQNFEHSSQIEAVLFPSQIEATQGSTIAIELAFNNLISPIQAADIILNYDPQMLDYVGITELNPNYFNPRALEKDEELIFSFVEKQATSSAQSNLDMVVLNFRAKTAGKTKLIPVFKDTGRSSKLITIDNTNNQLQKTNQVEILIR